MSRTIFFRAVPVFAFLATLLIASSVSATPEILDWDAETWLPAGNTNLSETFTSGSGDITVTFSGNTAGLEQAGADIAPSINQVNTGGLVPTQNGLYVGTDYPDNSNPMVMITIDFTGYPGGVGNISFDVFDMDIGAAFVDDMTVTAVTPSGVINPTSIVTGPANTQINLNTVRGTNGSGATSSNANITWVFGDAGTPVSGISQINVVWRNLIGTANPGLQWINIHDFFFDDPMADAELTKSVLPTSAGAGESVVFTLDVINNGPDDAPGVQVTDQLPAGYTYLSDNGGGSYAPGSGVWTVGTLAPSGTAQLQITARMEGTGPWDNSAEVTQILATDPDSTPGNNVPAEDDQDNAAVTLLVPEIGTAKAVTAGPVNNGDGTYTLTYTTTVQNSGATALNGIQVVDNLAATFAAATGFVVDSVTSADFAVNAGFDGSTDTALLTGTDSLPIAGSGTIALTVTVTPGGTPGPYDNTATAGGLSPGGVPVNDDSTNGANPDPDGDGNPGNNSAPTPATFSENPEIGTAKRVVATPINNGDGTRTLTYEINVVNSGDVALNGIQVVDDMAATFAAADGVVVDSVVSSDFTVNPGYDGNGNNDVLAGTDTLASGAAGTVRITVTVAVSGTLGTFQNSATASGTSPGGMGVNDVSQSGADPDPDGDGNPGNNSIPTPISFTENPQIGLAKAITAGPVNNGDGTHTLTYRFTIENFGDGALNSVQATDNLASTFSAATGFVVDSVTSADFAVNAAFNGNGNNDLLAGTDSLAIAAAGTVDLTVTVTPGGTLGPYDNTAFARGTSPAGTLTIDNSVDGLDPDPDGNGDPVDNVGPTPVTFGENPEIGTAKLISAGPVNNGDGTHTLTYRVTVANSGDVPLNNVQVVDDLATTFAAATGFVVDSVTSGDFSVNAGYNGVANTNVLAGTDSLVTGGSGTVDITVTVTPGGTLGPYDNNATASGTSPGGMGVNDVSNTGVNPDPDGDGDPGNNSVPTPVTFGENPEIGTAKLISAGPVNNGDGTHTLTYRITVANSGDVPLNNVQVVDSLASTFAGATGFVVDSVSSADFAVNAGFNGAGDTNLLAGTGTLAVGGSGTVDVTITVTPGGTLGPYNNTATSNGDSPAGTGVSDLSNTGVNPDPDGDGDPGNNSVPTPVTFGENPEIGTAKSVNAPTNNGDGTFTLSYTIVVENSGDVTLNNIQVVDSLATTYAAATGFVVDSVTSADFAVNAGFNGAGDTNVLAGTDTLATGTSGMVDVTVTVTPGGTLGPYDNTATSNGNSPAGTGVSDDSTTGVNPDPDGDGDPGNNSVPTPVTFGENPEIGTAKLISAGPTSNGDGTHTLTYRITVANSGDVPLNNVQVVDDLATTFATATGLVVDSVTSGDFSVNAGYNGAADTNVLAGTDSLATGAAGTVDITVTVTPGGTLGPYDNNATTNGTSPAGTGVSDVSNTGVNPDPDGDGNPGNNSVPTPVTFGENPEIGTAKLISAGPTSNGDGTHTLTYRITVANSGDVPLNNVQVVDSLATTFAGATGFVVDSVSSADFAVNAGFNGAADTNLLTGADTLGIGASGTVDMTVTVTPGGTLGPYDNTATGSGDSPAGTGVSDISTTGANPDPDGDGDPGNNSAPTPVTFGENPEIGTAKLISAGPTSNGDGTHTLTYRITVANSGDVPLNNVQVIDSLATTYASATGFVVDSVTSADFVVNAGFNGAADTNLLTGTDTLGIGVSGTVDVTLTVTPGGTLGPYDNTATSNGNSPAGTGVSDISTTGANPDPDGDGDPGNNSAPTPVMFGENPEIGTAKSANAPTNNGDGTFTLSYTVVVENSGDVTLNNIQVVDSLATTFAGATGFVVDSVTSGNFTVNPGYDGAGDTNLLAATDSLAIGVSGTISIGVTVTPGATLGPYNNTATSSGDSPAGTGVSDISTTGANPDPDGDGDPGNDSVPTPVSFDESPQIGVAKALTSGPVNNGDGTHTLTYTMTLENFGDVVLNGVQVTDNLAATFASATGFVVDSVTSSDFAVNAGYDGNGTNTLLDGTDNLPVGSTGTVALTVTVTPGGTLGPYDNAVFAQGVSPGGSLTLDNSVDGLDPDPDGNNDPVDNVGPTPVTFGENPEIGTAKQVSAGPISNGDGTFTVTYRVLVGNSGDVPLNNVQVVDNLATTFASATGFVVDSLTSSDFAVNAGYNGNGDSNLLSGTDSLAIGATGIVDITVTISPGGILGPYDNTATSSGDSPAGTGVSDISTDGVNPDPDGDGDPGNNSTPTPIAIVESPEIGTAKSVNVPTNNGDGTFTVTYTVVVQNSGDVALNNVQVVDDLATTYAGATGVVVDSVMSADFSVNVGFDGAGDTNVLAGTDSLATGTAGTISVQVTVTPGGTLGPYDNTATSSGTSPAGAGVSDISTTGANPDPDGDGDPGNNSVPTPVSFDESPQIGVAKAITAGPVNNGDGTHTLTYTMTLENFGDVVLNSVQAVDNLATTFGGATGFVVNTLTSGDFTVNAGFDGNGNNDLLSGTDSLAVGASGTIDLEITVTPGGTLGPYDNNVFVQGLSPSGSLTLDNSVDGLDPDPDGNNDPGDNAGPTPVTFVENPRIGTAKTITAGPTSNGDGTHTLTYQITVENAGDVALNNLQVVDNLATTYAAATGFVVDSLTSAAFAVDTGFNGATDTSLLAGTDTLGAGASGTIDVTVTVTPGGTPGPYNNTAISNGTSSGGTGVIDISTTGVNPDPDGDGNPGNNSVPTPVTFSENPEIGTAKSVNAPTNNGDGTFTLSYTVVVENSGDVILNNVQVVDSLVTTFAGATGFVVDSLTSADFTVNAGYDGVGDTNLLAATDSLATGASGTISIGVTVTPGATLGPYNNTATSSGDSPAGTGVTDDSTTGANPDPDGDGDPGNDSVPTPVSFDEIPQIGVAKSITSGPVNNGDGTYTLTYTMTLENFGDVVLTSVQAVENLAGTFTAATGFTVDNLVSADFTINPGFDGDTDRNLFDSTDSLAVGATGTLALTITVTPGTTLGPYDNTVFVQGFSPGGSLTLDNSVDGLDPDPDGNNDPVDNISPTPATFGENPEIGTAKSVSAPINNGDATFTLTYTVGVENSGDVILNNVQVIDDLATTFAGAAGYVVNSVSSSDFIVNSGYDGTGDTNLLSGSDSLLVGAQGSMTVTVTVTPGSNPGPYNNTAIASGESAGGAAVSDDSTDGVDADPGNDGPDNDMTPTPVSFGLEAALEGNAWLDLNIDDLFDSGEPPLDGWIIEVLQGGVVIATVPVNPDGTYSIAGLTPGGGYQIQLRHPSSNAVFGTIDGLVLPPGLTVVDQNLPIDPSGVVYDSDSRLPIPGVTVSLVDNSGTPLPAVCLLPDQQDQVTGADGLYRFDVLLGADPACPSGGVFDIVFTAPAGFVPGISPTIPPTPGPLSATGLPDPFQVQPQAGPPTGGASTLYYLSFMLSSGDPNIINNHIPLDPVAPNANLLVSKRADRRQTVVGDLIVYTITVVNQGFAFNGLTLSDNIPAGFTYVPGSARLRIPGGPANVTVTGQRPVVFSNIDVPGFSSVELRYMLRVGAGVVQGNYVNTVTPLLGGVPVGNAATATVTVTADPDFEQTTVVGMVFNDIDRDGWQDEGEHGIPGVRLATVEGLIIETDAFGRYHIAGVDGGRRDRGRNFIIKVDSNSLPDGVEFTTENPRVQRITEGLLNRFDFGVNLPGDGCCEQIEVKIGEVFFEQGSSAIRPEFMPLMQQLAQRLTDHRGGTLYIEGHAEPSEAVAYTPAAYTVTQHFDIRSARLSDADKRELDRIIERWRGVDNISVASVGHTCDTPIALQHRDEFKDNYALSIARAQTVASYVRLGLGIAPEQVTVTGKGPDEPVASNATPEGGALNRRVELSISGQRSERASNAADLARDRANSIYDALQKLLGDDLLRNINITSHSDAANNSDSVIGPRQHNKQESDMTSDANTGWLSRGAAALLGVLVSTANADGLPASCTIDSCLTEDGYAIQILPSSDVPSPNDTRAALADDKRVDISGRFSVPMPGGGQLWATEDPAAAEPRLAAHGPRVTPVADGRLAMPVSFYIYANYPAFIEKAEIQIYHGGDIDLIEPIAVIPFKPGVYSRIDWNGSDLTRVLSVNEELYFRVRAYDGDGHYDETHLDHFRLLAMDEYRRAAESDPGLLLPEDAGTLSRGLSSRGPLDGNVLVLQPPGETLRQTRGVYSLTSHFDTRKTVLKNEDRAEIDHIIEQWQGAQLMRLHVTGHTDSIRIAPEHRHEFADNKALSEARARVVAQYIAGRLGIDDAEVVSEGRAATEPVASNATAAGRAQNRRVELTITGMRAKNVTQTAGMTLVESQSNTSVNISDTLVEALNILGARAGKGNPATAASGGDFVRRYDGSAPAQSSAHALKAVYGQNNLRLQRIPVNGSRVRINGQDIGGNSSLRINGDPVPLDKSGKYAVEYVMPVGSHTFDVELIDGGGHVTQSRRLPVEVSGQHIFMVALADLTLSDNNVSGSIEPTSGDSRYDDDMLIEGRLAFYLKGKIKGKYLITAQLDSQEEELGDLFSNLFDKDPKSVLRRLDPDRYYPVYGDDSTTINDTDTQGRLYVRADWDKSRAVWGNFHTGLTGNEFAQYNRSLYGAQYQHQSLNVTSKGEARTEAIGFVSEAQTAFGHSEFLGTGGSLYYLKHQDILPGSEKAWIEVRDRDSERVRELVTLTRGMDYEVDEIQGRIILARPLMQVSTLQAPGLIKDTPLDGDDLVLLVDYEYVPVGFSPDKVTVGGSGRHWLTDSLAIGATVVDENRSGEDYSLLGGDVLWQPGDGTYLKAEFAQSEASQADRFLSSDGGLTFDTTLATAPGRAGDAWSVEARVNSREVMNTDNEWVGGAWYRRTDDNFSVARRDTGVDTTEYGLEFTGHLSARMNFSARASVVERELIDEDRRLSLQVDYSLTDHSSVSGEVRSVDEKNLATDAKGLLLALRYSHKLNETVEVYGIGQATLSNDSGRYDNNDLATIGVNLRMTDRTSLQGQYSTGHRGNGALLNAEYRLDERHDVYGTFTQSVDRTDLREPDTKIALGHRSRITDQATIFNERQFVEDRGQAGIAHVFGLDFELESGWAFGLSLQQGDLETDLGQIDRDAATLTADYRSQRLNWRGKVEYRDESGVSQINQTLTTNRLDLKLNQDWRLLARLNHAETEDATLTDRDDSALFTEAGVGFAYRPIANNRLNLLAKYTFLYDLPAQQQIDGGTDQRSHIVSVEGIYRLNPRWELGGKLAQRSGELRTDRDLGQWFESTTNFAALRARYHLIRRWEALLELRRLDVDEAQSTRTGWLLGLDRHINDSFRVGVGYNFTDFSDDLTNLDYDHKGWFLNALGKY